MPFLVAALVLTACSGSSGGSGATPTTLNVVLPAGRPDTTTFIKQHIPEFKSATGIDVNVIETPYDQLNTKLVTEFRGGGKTFDVVGMPHEWTPTYANYLLSIDDRLTQADKDDFLKAALASTTYKGHTYGLMYVITTMILFYRTDLLQAKGLGVPTTWSDYLSTAQALTSPPVFGTMVTAKNNPEPVGMFLNYLYQAGGAIDDDKGNVVINSDAGVKALQFMVDQVLRYKVAPPAASTYTTADTTTFFTEGNLAMAPNWIYMAALADGKDSKVAGKFGMAVLPCGSKCASTIGGWNLSIAKSSSNKDAAYKFIHFMTDTQRESRMAIDYGNPPTRNSSAKDPDVAKLAFLPVVLKALENGVPRNAPAWPQVETALAVALSGAASGAMSPKQALDQAASAIKDAQQQQ